MITDFINGLVNIAQHDATTLLKLPFQDTKSLVKLSS